MNMMDESLGNKETVTYGTWQPIGTAPHDGTAILICRCGVCYVVVYVEGYWVTEDSFGEYVFIRYPDGWMPLPEPIKNTEPEGICFIK
jgi:hypothetical protein